MLAPVTSSTRGSGRWTSLPASNAPTAMAPAPSATNRSCANNARTPSTTNGSGTRWTGIRPLSHEFECQRALLQVAKEAIGERRPRHDRRRVSSRECLREGRVRGRLHADHRHAPIGGRCNTGEQAAATGRDDDGSRAWQVLENLEGHGPCPGDHVRMVVSRDEHAVARGGSSERARLGLVVVGAVGDNRDAVAAQAIELGVRGIPRDIDGEARAEFTRDTRQRDPMVAGRGRHQGRQDLLAFGEREQGVARPASLEGAGPLQRFQLEPGVPTGRIGQAIRVDQWRSADVRGDAAGSRLDVSE